MSGQGGQTAEPPPVNGGGIPVKKFYKMSQVTLAPPLMVPSAAKKLRTPARSGYGSVGRKVMIKANHFLVGIGNKDPHQYDVTIAPEVTSKTKSRDIMKFLSDSYEDSHLGNLLLAYDGKKSAFAAGPLPFDSQEFLVNLSEQNGREREFKVTIKFAARKELDHLRHFLAGRQQDNPQETIQALDVVLRESASKDCEFGRGSLGDGIEYWKGFYQSLRPTQMGLSLNIDISARVFYEPKLLLEFVGEFLANDMSRPLTNQDRIKVKRALKGVRVEVCRQDYKRRYKVQGLTAQPISQLNFIAETGATKTVVQYFQEKYNVQLRFPALPAVQTGTDAKPTYLPMEICWVVHGQRYALKLNERQVTQFLRATCQRPKDREDSIDNTMKHNKYIEDSLVSEDFEMDVTELLTSIEARILPPPPLRYHESGRSSEVNPSVGQWNMIDLKVINGGTVNHWAVINFSRQNDQAVGRFVHGLVSMCQTKGIAFNPQPLIPMRSAMLRNIEKALVDLQCQASAHLARVSPGHQLQMLFVILPETKGTYPRIKRLCETELGIVSQCCKPRHVMKMSGQYLENVALKINVKVGGRNNVLSACLNGRLPYVTDRPTIIFGADVTHPQPGEDSSPSIAATMKHNKYNKDPLVIKDFEMNAAELLTFTEARILPPPPLRYHESGHTSEVNPSVGQWNMIDLKVINAGTVNYWTIVNFSRQNEQAVGRFVHGLVSMCQTKGIAFNPQPLIRMIHAAPHNIEKALVDLQSQCAAQLAKSAPGHQLQMLFVILPEAKGTDPRIKRVCETELGIVSQCCKPIHIMKMSNQYFENVALKINVKVRDRNTVLSATLNGRLPYVTDRPTIIFGADVTHPQPGEDSSPSIAAVVASMDWPQVTKYKSLVSAQPHRQEIISDLDTTSTDPKRGIIDGGLISGRFISFKKSTEHKPRLIIFYSEGQFSEVVASMDDRVPPWWFLSGGAKRRLDNEDEPSTSKRKRTIVGNDLFAGSVKLIPRTTRGALLERISNNNFTRVKVDGDGRCQYRSLSVVLYHNQEEFMKVKNAIIDHMRKNPRLYMAYGQSMNISRMGTLRSYSRYVQGLNKPYAWGNLVTLFAAANVFGIRITLVCSIYNEKRNVMEEVVPAHLVHNEDVYLSYVKYTDNNAHYDALFRSNDITRMPERYMGRDLFEITVKNLPYTMTAMDLRPIFGKFGKIKTTRVMKIYSWKIGFVEMESGPEMEAAVAGLNGTSLPTTWGTLWQLVVRVVRVSRFDLQADAEVEAEAEARRLALLK